VAATDRYSLIVESATRGEAELRRFEQTMNRVADVVERSQKRVGDGSRKVSDDTRQFATNLKNFLSNPLQAAGDATENFALRFGKLGVGIAAGTVAVGAAGIALVKFVDEVGNAAGEIRDLADRTGLSIAQIDRFQAAAKIANVNVEVLGTGSRKLAELLGDASTEGAKARETLESLGVSFFEAGGAQKDLNSVTLQVIEAIGSARTEAERLTLANKVLGKAGTELLPLIRDYQALDAEARKLGFGLDEGVIKRLDDASDEVAKLGLRWEILKRQLAEPASAVVNVVTRVLAAFDQPPGGAPRPSNTPIAAAVHGDVSGRDFALFQIEQFAFERDETRRRTRLAEGFRSREALTIGAGQRRLSEIEGETFAIRQALQSGDLDEKAFREKERQLAALEHERRVIESRIKAEQKRLAKAEALAEFEFIPNLPIPAPGRVAGELRAAPSLFRPQELIRGAQAGLGTFVAAGENAPIDVGAAESAQQLRARLDAVHDRDLRHRDLKRKAIEQELALEERRVQLLLGPAGEAAAIERITRLRLDALEKQKTLGLEAFELEIRRNEILQQRELELMEIQIRRVERFTDAAGQLFDSLTARGSVGLQEFFVGQARLIERQIFQNIAGEIARGATGHLSLPGQVDKEGKPTLLGRVLANTPFAADPLKIATDLNTTATDRNTAAIGGLSVALANPAPAGGATAPLTATGDLLRSVPGLGSIGGIVTGIERIAAASKVAGKPGGSIDADTRRAMDKILTDATGLPSASPAPKLGAASVVGAAGAIAAGAFGVASGVRQGGARGAVTATGSALGTVGALLPLLGVTGPLAPILLGGALGLGLASSFFPNPKAERDKRLNELIEGARFEPPAAASFAYTTRGAEFDYDRSGGMREVPIVVQVQTMDARSFEDNSEQIADAVRHAMERGHRINRTAQEVVLNQ
jgi:hypothetical protein